MVINALKTWESAGTETTGDDTMAEAGCPTSSPLAMALLIRSASVIMASTFPFSSFINFEL
jgi:hypothetical protein